MSHPPAVYHQSVVMPDLTAGTEFSEVDLWNAKAEDFPNARSNLLPIFISNFASTIVLRILTSPTSKADRAR